MSMDPIETRILLFADYTCGKGPCQRSWPQDSGWPNLRYELAFTNHIGAETKDHRL